MRKSVCGGFAMIVFLIGAAPASARELTVDERVKGQEALERVYYAHQIGNTRPFEDAVPKSVIERQVDVYLKQAAALQTIWKTPTTDAMLDRELQRMTARSRMPERLRELFRALGDDPLVIRECLVRPLLVERLSRDAFGSDDAIHAAKREEAEELRRGLLRLGVENFVDDPRRTVVELVRDDVSDPAPTTARSGEARAISLNPEAFGRWRSRAPGRLLEIGAVRSERDAFVIAVVLDERPGRTRMAFFTVAKRPWSDWWDQAEASLDPRTVQTVAVDDGSRSLTLVDFRDRPSPSAPAPFPSDSDDAWDDGSLDDLPHARANAVKVWTGSLMVVWGGTRGAVLNTGGRYDPATDSWTAMETENAPAPSEHPSADWTGSAVAVRAGDDAAHSFASGRYDPMTDAWSVLRSDPRPARDRNATVADSGREAVAETITANEPDGASGTGAPPELAVSSTGGLIPRSDGTGDMEFPYVSEDPSGFTFPTEGPVPSEIFLGTQGTYFGHCRGSQNEDSQCTADSDCPGGTCERIFDNALCLAYNEDCSGVRKNKREYAFSDVFETTYDSAPAEGRQTWIERNWNYDPVVGPGWRPFHFALEVDANSTCVGGNNEGAFCTVLDEAGVCGGGGTCTGAPPSGGARWTFTPNNRNGNTSLQLRWPWVATNARLGTDPYFLYGFSSWMRTSSFDPGTTTAGARFTTYVDHSNDRRGPNLDGIHSVIDFNTTSANGKVSWLHAGFFDARVSGSTPGRTIDVLTGVRSEVNLVSTGGPQLIGQTYGVLVQFNPSGTGIADSGHTGILINTPAPPGSGTTIGTQNGLWVADQQLARSGGGGSAILVSAQTVNDASEGNLRLDGANWNNGHIQLFQAHLWRDAVRGVLRYKNAGAPVSETDGNALVTGTGSDAHGVVLWGVSTAIDPSFDTGDEVCAASGVGLKCVETSDLNRDASTPCDQTHSRPKWLAFCK
jgi:hypothetical protein